MDSFGAKLGLAIAICLIAAVVVIGLVRYYNLRNAEAAKATKEAEEEVNKKKKAEKLDLERGNIGFLNFFNQTVNQNPA